MQVTLIYKMNNFSDEKQDRFEMELFGTYSLNPKMQQTGFGAESKFINTVICKYTYLYLQITRIVQI